MNMCHKSEHNGQNVQDKNRIKMKSFRKRNYLILAIDLLNSVFG